MTLASPKEKCGRWLILVFTQPILDSLLIPPLKNHRIIFVATLIDLLEIIVHLISVCILQVSVESWNSTDMGLQLSGVQSLNSHQSRDFRLCPKWRKLSKDRLVYKKCWPQGWILDLKLLPFLNSAFRLGYMSGIPYHPA